MPGLQVYFGGTFDPPHQGHDDMLRALAADAWVERVHLVPTGENPLKPSPAWVGRTRRRAWIERWVASLPEPMRARVQLETLEIDRESEGPQYTVETLAKLRGSSAPWVLAVGGDIVSELGRWKNVESLLSSLHSLWIFPRGERLDPVADMDPALRPLTNVRLMADRVTDVSSTALRAATAIADSSERRRALAELPLIPALLDDLLAP